MTIDNIDVNKTLEKAREILEKETNISSAFRAVIEVLFVLITILINRLNLNSKNSSKSPSSDSNRQKKNKENTTGKNPGGQHGHPGKNIKPVENLDEIENIKLNQKTLPAGKYHDAGYQARQVIQHSNFKTCYRISCSNS